MIAAALVLMATPAPPLPARSASFAGPSPADAALLLHASRACRLHAGAAYFVKYAPAGAAVVHLSHALGDSDAQIVCVLQSLPADFMRKYRVDVETKPRRRSTAKHR